jgi:hypothetical protein
LTAIRKGDEVENGKREGNVVPQLYETELEHPGTGHAVRFLTVPARSVAERAILSEPEALMAELELRPLGDPLHASEVPYAVASVLLRDDAVQALEHFYLVRNRLPAFMGDHPQVLEFSEYVSFARVVPFEHSPLGGEALGNLLASGSGAGIGAGIGFIVAGGPTPLLFVTVPAGMIICGSAKGIADGLGEGLRYRVRRLMGLKGEEQRA